MLLYPPVRGSSGIRGRLAGTASTGCRSDSAGGSVLGTPGPGATVRGPAAPGPDGVSRGGIAQHAAASLCCVLAAAGLTACGATTTRPAAGDGPRVTATAPGSASATQRAASAPAAPVVRTPAAAARGAAPAARGTAAAGATAAPPTDPPLPSGLPSSAPLRVRLAAACVTPGGEQSVVVETLADAYVAFDNLYPDGRTGAAYGGHEASGRTGADGRFTAVWRVAPGTPAGRVRVDVGVSARDGSAITMAYYQLATRC